uniref:Uncharacterized protein n=1 Tax=Mus musculus TaxID=10090 RepID=Q3U5E9_MOUSE|nr:unnamed protein product [Mus musculus]
MKMLLVDEVNPKTVCEDRDSPKPSRSPHIHPLQKPGRWTRTVSPEKATGSQETAPLPDCSQKISTAQSQSSCSALLTPHPSSEARSRERGPGWLTSSLIVFQTMGKVPLSQIRDSQH